MTETPFYFPNGDYSLFGVLHEPVSRTTQSAFVFCHPFGEEKLWTQRVFVSFARRLAAEGHPVLRFDYMGNGDSDHDFSRSSLTTALADVRCAVAEVRRRSGADRVDLLGLRLGATVASLAAEEEKGIDRVVLWAPIVDGARYMQEVLRTNVTTQMATYKEVRHDREALVAAMERGSTVNVDGYEMSLPLYSEMSAVRLADGSKRFDGRCLVVQIDRQTARVAPELQQLASSYAAATLTCVSEEPFWKEIQRFYEQAPNLFAATGDWLRTA